MSARAMECEAAQDARKRAVEALRSVRFDMRHADIETYVESGIAQCEAALARHMDKERRNNPLREAVFSPDGGQKLSSADMDALDEVREALGAYPSELTIEAVKRLMAEKSHLDYDLQASRKREDRIFDEVRRALGAGSDELTADAAKRVAGEKDRAVLAHVKLDASMWEIRKALGAKENESAVEAAKRVACKVEELGKWAKLASQGREAPTSMRPGDHPLSLEWVEEVRRWLQAREDESTLEAAARLERKRTLLDGHLADICVLTGASERGTEVGSVRRVVEERDKAKRDLEMAQAIIAESRVTRHVRPKYPELVSEVRGELGAEATETTFAAARRVMNELDEAKTAAGKEMANTKVLNAKLRDALDLPRAGEK